MFTMAIELSGLKLLDVQEISDTLGINIATIRRYLHTGKIRAKKIGIKIFANEEDVKSFLLSSEYKPQKKSEQKASKEMSK